MSSEQGRAIESLNGLTLAEAFRAHVVRDSEVADLGRRLMERRPGHSAIFVEGRFPGAMNDFYWPLHATTETISYGFVDSFYVDFGRPLPQPSELETQAARVFADRMRRLVDPLSNGQMSSVGTFSMSGIEGPIGSGQWTRKDLAIDIENSALCELRDGRRFPLWTGIRLKLPVEPSAPIPHRLPSVPTKARTQIETKNNCRNECFGWLESIMSNVMVVPWTVDQLWAEAKQKWPNKLSEREFHKCRADVLMTLSEEQRYLWSRPGPRRKSPQF